MCLDLARGTSSVADCSGSQCAHTLLRSTLWTISRSSVSACLEMGLSGLLRMCSCEFGLSSSQITCHDVLGAWQRSGNAKLSVQECFADHVVRSAVHVRATNTCCVVGCTSEGFFHFVRHNFSVHSSAPLLTELSCDGSASR